MRVERFNLGLSKDLSSDDLESLISAVGRVAAAKRSAVIVGVTGSNAAVMYWIEVEPKLTAAVLAQLQTSWPGVRIEQSPVSTPEFTLVGGLGLSTGKRPLNSEANVADALAAVARSLHRGEVLQWQLMLTAARSPRPAHSGKVSSDPWRASKVLFGVGVDPVVSDGRDRSDLNTKHKTALVNALGTLAVRTAGRARDRVLVGQALAGLRSAEAPGVRVGLRTGWQSRRQQRLLDRRLPSFEWPLQLNVGEAAALLGWPTGPAAERLSVNRARWMAAPRTTGRGVIVGETQDARGNKSDLVLPIKARTMHCHVVGPTGVGKSTVLAHGVLQDIAAGRGVVVLDPKRDLVEAILQRLPADQAERVVVFDPALSGTRLLGLNPLRGANPEIVTDFVVHTMRGLFARAWGPRTEDVLRTGVLTLALAGSYTLVDLSRLLTDKRFRSQVQAVLPAHRLLVEYWCWFEQLSEAQRGEITAPLLSRLRSVLMVGPLRDILSIAQPRFDLDVVFRKRLVVLAPLSAGQIGEGAAGLLGSLLMARLWQLTQQRSTLPERMRHPVMVYLDEFHQYLHLPTSMSETLAQARGLGVGLTLAHQHLDQLTPDVRSAVMANARNRVVFQLPAKDAVAMAADMAPLEADDFKNLGPFEIYLRTMHNGAVQLPVSGLTKPLGPGNPQRAKEIRRRSLNDYGDPIGPPRQPQDATANGVGVPPIGFKPRVDDEQKGAA